MKAFLYVVIGLALAACGGTEKNGFSDGTFKAAFGETKIEIPVKCGNFNSDTEFYFRSDNGFGNKDTDGDGILLSVERMKLGKDKTPVPMDGIIFEITINGEKYGSDQASLLSITKSKQSWTKEPNAVRGKDILSKEGEPGSEEYPISYEVVCS